MTEDYKDLGFKFDLKKHDNKIPDKPKVLILNCPKCGEVGKLVPLNNMIAEVFRDGKVNMGLAHSNEIICSSCAEVIPLEMFQNALRERLYKQTPKTS